MWTGFRHVFSADGSEGFLKQRRRIPTAKQLLRKALPPPVTQRRQQAHCYGKFTAASRVATLPGDRLQNEGGPSQAHSEPKHLVIFPPKIWFSLPHSTGNNTVWIRHPGQFFVCKLAIITFHFCHLLTAMSSGSRTLPQYIQHLTQWGVKLNWGY